MRQTPTEQYHPQPDGEVSTWLASALPHPEEARAAWRHGLRPPMIPMGTLFDAIRMPEQLVYAATGHDAAAPYSIATALSRFGLGPVIRTYDHWYYALVPPQTAAHWTSPHAVCRSSGAWMPVPAVNRTTPDHAVHWTIPPARARHLGRPGVVVALLERGDAALEDASAGTE
ncbi:hypothetical protein ABT160_35935 [Streptomyces sp. NPDC001941]|uniref:hypothetical protein n=1 Tax=Streptomyces sp. NPDC001941 TaxID=3154659 RepID=UPI0033218872